MSHIKSGIYCVINTVNNKYYVGSSIYLAKRWKTNSKEARAKISKALRGNKNAKKA